MAPQLDASILSAKNENNIGLINLSVDFALVKVEVPKQFEGFGKALSPYRRENAERGPQHRTARRLGALFEQVIPNIDVLAAAYGERVSEIATSCQLDLKDADNIMALHLLACMLARMLSDAEATAMWVQLVESRLKEMEHKADPSQIHGMVAIYAMEHGRQITRDDLAAWDASARAWLQIANQAKRYEDTQLKLILKNIISIEDANVVEFWIVAMTTIQNSIQGVPQDITNSAVLLGLMSWHIYPDLHVFSPNQYVEFHDPLVKAGGVITLGLEQQGENRSGVSWSVSLSHLRFYGDPVTIEKSSEEDSDRLTAQELRLVAFGGVLGSWANPASVNINEAAKCFDALGNLVQYDNSKDETSYDAPLGWIAPLIDAARFFLSSVGNERKSALYFIEFGRRRGRKFLDDDFHNALPMFGLSNPYVTFHFYMEPRVGHIDSTEYIARLRQLAEDCNFHKHDAVIVTRSRYFADPTATESDEFNGSDEFDGNWEFASAIPAQSPTAKRSIDGELQVTQRHARWIHIDRTQDPAMQRYLDISGSSHSTDVPGWTFIVDDMDGGETSIAASPACNCRFDQQNSSRYCQRDCPCQARGFYCTSACLCLYDFDGFEGDPRCANIRNCVPQSGVVAEDCFWLSTSNKFDGVKMTSQKGELHWKDPPNAYFKRYSDMEVPIIRAHDEETFNIDGYRRPNAVREHISFKSVYVNSSGGLFLSDRAVIDIPSLSLSRLTRIFRSESLNALDMRKYLQDVPQTGMLNYSTSLTGVIHHSQLFFKSLKAMAAISDLYAGWPEATISIATTKKPLGHAYWTSNVWNHSKLGADCKLWRSTKFSCLAMLESGGHDIHPDQVKLVLAMATGNSIYTSEALLQDPSLPDNSGVSTFTGIRRIIGNVGHPGVVLLTPPPIPRVLQVDETKGRFVQAGQFDGTLRNLFTQTSMHLKFTEFKVPLASARGAVDADVVLREALISVYDGPRWIADLDILQAFESPNLTHRVELFMK
ncbi:hypothetical protein FSARC_12137 [Fusarium sarcochroum]|uniref:Uncharacterized protein n=1 Tax=Fusarium sarcochroum TaxID=1208366 RepID=A0A8H4TAS4_9HYPO|nr:hypothetical protein FSARC_12137 [Fusarium sarcochroum]